MAVAWTTLAILLLLLPGLLSFVAFYARERGVSRYVMHWTSPGQLAGVLASSFIVHGALYLALFATSRFFCSVGLFFEKQLGSLWKLHGGTTLEASINSGLPESISWFILYVLLASVLGFGLGELVAHLAEGCSKFRAYVSHPHEWLRYLFDLNEQHLRKTEESGGGTPLPYTFVHLKAESENGVVMYRGMFRDAFTTAAGGPSYVTFHNCTRFWFSAKSKDNSKGYDLRMMSVAAADGLVNEGRNLVIVALVGTDLHIRIFDASGKKVVDKAENELVSGETLTALKKQLTPIPDESGLSKEDKQKSSKMRYQSQVTPTVRTTVRTTVRSTALPSFRAIISQPWVLIRPVDLLPPQRRSCKN